MITSTKTSPYSGIMISGNTYHSSSTPYGDFGTVTYPSTTTTTYIPSSTTITTTTISSWPTLSSKSYVTKEPSLFAVKDWGLHYLDHKINSRFEYDFEREDFRVCRKVPLCFLTNEE